MAGTNVGDWYRSIPVVSRYLFTGMTALPLLGRFGVVSFPSMSWSPAALFQNFEIWRPLTAILYYPITPQTGFHYLMNLYFFYSYSTRLETGIFDGKTADYVFAIFVKWMSLLVIGGVLGMPLLMDSFIMAVLYLWAQINKDEEVTFWFGMKFKAMYLPWVLTAFNFLLRGGGMAEIVGILVGHLYYFLEFKYPVDFNGPRWLATPQFLYNWFPNRRGATGFGQAPGIRMAPSGSSNRSTGTASSNTDGGGGVGSFLRFRGGHSWGSGNRLGDN